MERGVDNHVERRKTTEKKEQIKEHLGDSPRIHRRQEIMEMDVDEIEEEIIRIKEAIEDNLWRRAEQIGLTVAAGYGAPHGKKVRLALSKTAVDADDSGNRWAKQWACRGIHSI